VEYRRDALGSGGPIAIPPTTDEFNGSVVSQHGKLIAVEGEGLVIEGATPAAVTGTPTPHFLLDSLSRHPHRDL
jgi:hypothetical protein